MEEFQFKKSEENPLEEVRAHLWELKTKKADPHFNYINPDELTVGDLSIADKLFKKELTGKEFDKFRSDVSAYCQQKREKGKFDEMCDSRTNLRAWISNKLVSFEYDRRHQEKIKKAA